MELIVQISAWIIFGVAVIWILWKILNLGERVYAKNKR